MRSETDFASKTDFQRRLRAKLSIAKTHSAHFRDQQRWRRISMLITSVYFASFSLHIDNSIVIGSTLTIALACAYGAGMSKLGRTVPVADARRGHESF